MDSEAVNLLLETQQKAFRSAVDNNLDQLKEKIQNNERNIADLVKSLEFSQAEIIDLKSEVKVLQESIKDSHITIVKMSDRIVELESRINYNEDYSRRNNLRITGIKEQPGETWEQIASQVSRLLDDKLQLLEVRIERAHRVGAASASYPRTIVARFTKFSDRDAALRNAKKLKGTGFFFSEDLCQASQEKKKAQLPLLKQARQDGKIAFFNHTRLIIRERRELGEDLASSVGSVVVAGASASDGVITARSRSGEGNQNIAQSAPSRRNSTSRNAAGENSGVATRGQKVTRDRNRR